MSDDEIKIQKLDKILDIVEKILEFNRQSQEGKGLRILTPDQMLSTLPTTLAQSKAGSNSEIRQLLYSFHRSKKLAKRSMIILLILFNYGNNLYEH